MKDKEDPLPKKKKKFLYLEKFDSYKDDTDLRLAKLENKLNWLMVGILVISACVITTMIAVFGMQ